MTKQVALRGNRSLVAKNTRKDPQRAMKMRLTALMLGAMALAGAVLSRAVYIQLVGDPRLETMARRQFQSKVLIRPRRGPILDRTGEAFAVNVETQSLAANPLKIRDPRSMARILSRALDIPYGRVAERLGEKREFVWIKRHIPEAELNRFKKTRLMDPSGDLATGLWMVKESQRKYPKGELAAHVLGDVNLDSEGLEGVELWANDRLRGKVVSVTAFKDAYGRPTFIDAVAAEHVKDGAPVKLTLDASLQFSVEEELHNSIAKTGSRAGTAIVMNAVTGEILALAVEPSFNPNDKNISADRRRNRALTDGYEPGSTLKPVLLASALSHGFKLTDTLWGERGSFKVQGKRISEAEAKERFEWINLKQIIQLSSNVGAAKLALKLGADHYLNGLKLFGFGARTDTGFPGEIPGRVPPRKAWQPLTLANIGFGQGILVTPMQMLRSYAVFANGGWLVQPTLLKDASAVSGYHVDVPRRILSQKISDSVVDALKSVTEEKGTGVKARLEGYTVAGKTGTAQCVDPATGKYSRSKHIASFIGFPVGIEPKLVIFTSLDEPHGVYFASETAAPLFKAVLNATANRFSLPAPQAPKARVLATSAAKASQTDRIRYSLAKVIGVDQTSTGLALHWQGNLPDGSLTWKMPSLRGLTAREALRALQGHKFQVEVHGTGLIHAQVPDEGKIIADGGTVRITLAEP